MSQTDAGDDSSEEMNTVDWERKLRDELLGHADAEEDSEEEAFLDRALQTVVRMLAENHRTAEGGLGSPEVSDFEAVGEMLDGSVKEVKVRTNGSYAAPKVTVWLNEHPPVWGNTATTEKFKFSKDQPHYNGKETLAILDVRPF